MLSFTNNFYSCADIKKGDSIELDFKFLTLYVQSYNKLASYAIFGKSENLLQSTIKVLSKSLMDVSFLADHGEDINNFISTYTIPFVREMFSEATFKLIDKDFKGISYVANEQFLRSLVKIRDYNYLDIMFDALQSPDIVERIECLQDTYTTSFRPTMNYGTYGSLVTGPTLQGSNLSYVYIPLDRIYQIIDTGMDVFELYLIIESPMTQEVEVTFNVILTEWAETSLTWRQEIRKSDISFTGTFVNGKMKLDIAELINTLHEREYKGLNIQIECQQEVAMFSKESGHGPVIQITWRDPEWSGFLGNLGLSSTAILKAFDNRDLNAVVQILEKFTLECGATIQKLRSNIECIANIKGFESSKFPGRAEFVPKVSELESVVLVKNKNKEDFVSNAHIPSSQVISSFWLRMQKGLQSEVIIRSDNFSDYVGHAYVVAYAINGLANIVRELSLQGMAKIIGTTYTDFNSTSVISKIKADMESVAKLASNSFDIELSSEAVIVGSYLYSNVSILQDTKLTSIADVNPLLEKDMQSTIWINPSTNEISAISGNAKIKLPTKDFYSSTYINGCKTEELNSIVEFSKIKSDIISDVIFRITTNNEFCGSVTIRNSGTIDFKGKTDLYRVSDMTANVSYRYKNDLYSEATVLQRNIADLDSTSLLSTDSLVTFIKGKALIRNKDRVHLVCSAKIRSSARKWVPNIHASHIFNYGRKLPRQYGN